MAVLRRALTTSKKNLITVYEIINGAVYYIIDSVNHKNRPKYFLTVYEIVNGCEHRRQH